jgi:hypothetical protein
MPLTDLRTLTYLRSIPTDDLLLRVMGPDEYGAAYYVARVRHSDRATTAELVPVPPGWTYTVWRPAREQRGSQEWILPSAVEFDVDGYARLARTRVDEPA